ncbi:hypothetical protein F5Y15DRAFT_362321 [Xylariaceae sp. FL0016]|nr:hypothetical protein F5Y15DRAFT_362321 [Xylariaceae sp. FL0016]
MLQLMRRHFMNFRRYRRHHDELPIAFIGCIFAPWTVTKIWVGLITSQGAILFSVLPATSTGTGTFLRTLFVAK